MPTTGKAKLILEKGETNEVSPMIIQALSALWDHRAGKGTREEHGSPTEYRSEFREVS